MSMETEAPLLLQQDLYFGKTSPYSGEVSQEQFQAFIDNIITPRFPAGLTVYDGNGQLIKDKDIIITGTTNTVSIFVEDTSKSQVAIKEIIDAYNRQFQEASVWQVTNRDDLKVSFGVGEDLIDNDSSPELIQVDLFFGRNIAGVGEVSPEEFQTFIDNVITPRFPAGLTVFDTNGQFQDSTGTIIEEPSKVVSLILEDTETNEAAINEIVETYIQQFQQESVLQAVNEDIKVSFGPTDNLIDNDLIPELIQVDLVFGRNIAGVGEVSPEEFQAFLDNVVTPRFPAGLTVFDTNGQFQDSTGTIIEEPSKVVSLILEDTETNEAAINEIVEAYIQQFQQESVLVIVDEDIQADFTAGAAKVAAPVDLFGSGVVGLSKTPDTLLTANTQYNLQVEVGNPTGINELNDDLCGDQAQLLADETVLAAEQKNFFIQKGNFETSTLTFTALADSPYLGQNLGIGLVNFLQVPSWKVDFDIVRLADCF